MNRLLRLPVSLLLVLALTACGASSDDPAIPAGSQADEDDRLREVGPIDDLPSNDTPDDQNPDPGNDPGNDDPGNDTPDDQNPGDGSTSGCSDDALGANEACEIEPNDELGTAQLIAAAIDSEIRIVAQIQPGDVDLYQLTIDEPVELTAYTSNGAGDCAVDTVLALGNSDGYALAEDDDGGLSPCSQVNVDSYPAAALSRAGTYYLAVGGFFDMETGPYTLHVSLRRPVCGDRRLSAGEECDDGNLADEDGCDGQCRYEATEKLEPNDSPDQPDGPHVVTAAEPMLLRGAVESGDVDVFAVPMARGDSFVRIEVLAAGLACDTDVALTLVAPDGETVLASNSDAFGSSCALLNASEDLAVGDVQAGTHYIEVAQYGAQGGSYLLNVVTHQAECGNGLREGDEMCDDANDDVSDGCDACALDADPEVEPNDDIENAFDLGRFDETQTTVVAGNLRGEDVDFFGLQILDNAHVEIWTDDGTIGCELDTVLELRDPAGELIAYDDDSGVSGCSLLDKTIPEMRDLEAGAYLIELRPYYADDAGFYALHVSVRYPSCGDGLVEGTEICDDANEEDEDGCSALCQPEGAPEVEPNDNLDDVVAVIDLTGSDEVLVTGAVGVTGDVDFYRVTVSQGAQLGARLWNGSGGCGVDSRVSLRSDAETVLRSGVELDDAEGCWQIGGVDDAWGSDEGLDAGEYLLRVAGRGGDTGAYQLVLWADVPE